MDASYHTTGQFEAKISTTAEERQTQLAAGDLAFMLSFIESFCAQLKDSTDQATRKKLLIKHIETNRTELESFQRHPLNPWMDCFLVTLLTIPSLSHIEKRAKKVWKDSVTLLDRIGLSAGDTCCSFNSEKSLKKSRKLRYLMGAEPDEVLLRIRFLFYNWRSALAACGHWDRVDDQDSPLFADQFVRALIWVDHQYDAITHRGMNVEDVRTAMKRAINDPSSPTNIDRLEQMRILTSYISLLSTQEEILELEVPKDRTGAPAEQEVRNSSSSAPPSPNSASDSLEGVS
jgi:hypothetical protein